MTYEEIISKVREKIEVAEMSKTDLAMELQINPSNLNKILDGESCMIYLFLDLLDEVGLELVFNDTTPIRSHQELIDYVSNTKYVRRQVFLKSKVTEITIINLEKGKNVQTVKALKVLEAMGIDVRVV